MPIWWLICDPWCSCTITFYIATISHAHMVAYLQSVVQLHHHSLYSHHQISLQLPNQTKTAIKSAV